jgi:predicted methyltransferase
MRNSPMHPRTAATVLVFALAACAGQPTARAPDYAAVVAAPDRSDADRQTDVRRNPAQLLAFTGVRPGMKVLDMDAAAGYTTELLARVVGPGGIVYAQDPPGLPERAKERFDARLRNPALKNIVRVTRPFDDPVPPDVRDLDVITFFFGYHDTTFMPVDRMKMNQAMFAALKPGGVLVIADHSAKAGDGVSVGKSLHRIEEGALVREVEAAGFRLVERGEFLRHPEDPRDTIVFRPQVPVDEFVLKFGKPR